jgi:hypothetical protein
LSFTVDEHNISSAGDPFYAAHDLDRPHACYHGVVYVGHLVEDEGSEEVEVVEVMPCRRCKAGVED